MTDIYITDPRLISKYNPAGHRDITQDDIDQLVRDRYALHHLMSHVGTLIPSWMRECEEIMLGTYTDPTIMTEEQKAAFITAQDVIDPVPTFDDIQIITADGMPITFDKDECWNSDSLTSE